MGEVSPVMMNSADTEASASPDVTSTYSSREAVGVFSSFEALEGAVDQLEITGFDRATLSVLATDTTIKDRVGRLYRSVGEIEDNSRIPQSAFASTDSRVEGEAAAVGIPLYIGGVAGAGAAVAYGGALAATIAATLAGGVVGAELGAILAVTISRRHSGAVAEQVGQGGMVLWVNLRDADAEHRALEILTMAGARDVHVHEVQRQWTVKDRPLADVQPDPFLWWT